MVKSSLMASEAYAILELSQTAGLDEIKTAYRRLAKTAHPDFFPGDMAAAARFARIAEAYARLTNAPDAHRPVVESAPSVDITRGADIMANIEVPLEFALRGGSATATVPEANRCRVCSGEGISESSWRDCAECRGSGQGMIFKGIVRIKIECPTCKGSGKAAGPACYACNGSGRDPQGEPVVFQVPLGFEEGGALRLRGKGAPAAVGGNHGDLIIVLRSAKHQRFKRSGSELMILVWVSFADLCLGTKVTVPMLGGGNSDVVLPPGTQAGHIVRLPLKGLPDGDGGMGDMIVKFQPRVPKILSDKQGELLRHWRQSESVR